MISSRWLWLVLLVPGAALAQAFPADSAYAPVTCGGIDSIDPAGDQPGANGSADIVGEAGSPALLFHRDGTHLFLRMRVDGDPRRGMGFDPASWGFELDRDSVLDTYEVLALLDGSAAQEEVLLESNDVAIAGDPADPTETNLAAYAATTHATATDAGSTINGDADFFVTIAIPIDDLIAAGIPLDALVVWAGTSASANSLDLDLACHDATAGAPSLGEIPVDPIDLGGPSIAIIAPAEGETVTTSTPVFSGTATPGETVTIVIDGTTTITRMADATGAWSVEAPTLADGPHTIVASVSGGTAMDTRSFVVATATGSDRDSDGVPDAIECASDPCPDTDGDGTPDIDDEDDDDDGLPTSEEGSGDLDRDDTPDHLDPDDDGDGIPTADERADAAGNDDADGDGALNWRDVDADGDGIDDGSEADDADGDGTPDYLQPQSSRGWVGGAVCSASPGGSAPWALALFVLVWLLARFRLPLAARGLAALLFLAPAGAAAQAVHLDHFRSAEMPEDGFAISRPNVRGHMLLGARLALDYAFDPLVVEAPFGDPDGERGAIVAHQLVANAVFSLGVLDRLLFFAGLPVNLVMEGDDLLGEPPADGTTLGDVYAGVRGRMIGEATDMASLGLQLTATFPTAQAAHGTMRFSGEDGTAIHPELVFELRVEDWFRVAANLGGRFRLTDSARFQDARGREILDVSHELTWGVGVAIPILPSLLEAHVEGWGTTTFESFGERSTSPIELLAGAKLEPIPGLVLGLAVGLGVARGYGAPDFRGVLTFGYAEPIPVPRPREETEAPAPADRDPEVAPDEDPPVVATQVDECPDEPEDEDGFEDEDGCPDPDNDADQVLDDSDECPIEREDRDGFEDTNGCPDPDNDGDSVLDAQDECPLAPGPAESRGCSGNVRLEISTGRIVILRTVEFASNRDRILPASAPILEELAAILAMNPEIVRVRVEGHTDDRGRDARNLDLSARRARSVMRDLIARGVAAERLEASGCGELHAIGPNDTDEGRQANRRVELHIVDPPPENATAHEGCTVIQAR